MTRLSSLACWFALFLGMCATASGQAIQCTTSSTFATVRAGGLHERTGDLILACTGGSRVFPQNTVPQISITVSMSADAAGYLYAEPWTEALLLIDDPAPNNQFICAATNPTATCAMTGSSGEFPYGGSPNRPNVYQGQRVGNNFIWPSVPFDPPGSDGIRRLRFTNLKVDVSDLAAGSIFATVSMQGQFQFQIANPTRTVASVQAPMSYSNPVAQGAAGQLTGFTMNVQEQYGSVWRTRSAAGPFPADQNEIGLAYLNSESGFHNSSFPNVPGRANLATLGLADYGTRIGVILGDIPPSITVTAPLTLGNNVARLVTAAFDGSGPFLPAPTTTTLANQDGIVAAVYEIVTANPGQLENLTFSLTLTPAPGAAPMSSVSGVALLLPLDGEVMFQPSFDLDAGFQFQVNAPTGPPLTITTQSLPGGFINVPYNQTVQASGGTPPYQFRLDQANTLPPGLTISTAGAIAGTPTTPGKFTFTVRVTDAGQAVATRLFTIDVGNAPPPVSASPRSLEFTAAAGGGQAPVQSITVVTTGEGATQFRVRTDGGEGIRPPVWLSVRPPKGTTPARLLITADPGNLPPGDYSGRVLITDLSGSLVLDIITVRLRIEQRSPQLQVFPAILRINERAGQPAQRREIVLLRNSGGGGPFPVKLTLLRRSSWIKAVLPSETTAPVFQPRAVAIDIDTAGLVEGFYRDVLLAEWSGGTTETPIVLWVAPAAPLLKLSDNGLFFTSRQGERNPVVKRVRVLNKFPNTTLQWKAEAILGGDWLSISPASGQATFDLPSTIRFSLLPNVANLPVGRRYALVRVSDPAAIHSPQFIVIVLQIAPLADAPLLDFEGGGIVLTGVSGGGRVTRDMPIRTASTQPVPYTLSAATEDEVEDWLGVTPRSGLIDVNTGAQGFFTVTADPSRLPAGVHRGQVVSLFAGNVRTMNVVFVVAPADTSPATEVKSAARAASCVPKKLAVMQTALIDNFAVPAGWPASLSVELRNDCGAAIANGAVVASFSNGDAPLSLESEGSSGIYSATWQPGVAAPEMNVTIRALAGGFEEATMTMVGAIAENKVPVLFPDGTIHINYHPVEIGAPLAPGMPVEMYGQSLATGIFPATQVPLSTDLSGTSVLIGPYDAPLFFASPGQVNVQLPWELIPNRRYSILAIVNGEPTQPAFIDIAPNKPGVTNTRNDARELIVQHVPSFALVTPQNPAKRGGILVMYLVGLGATDVPIATGAPSPSPAAPKQAVELTVGGIPATVLGVAMTPGGVGLAQVAFTVPDGVALDTPLDVVVTQNGVASNVTKLTVAP